MLCWGGSKNVPHTILTRSMFFLVLTFLCLSMTPINGCRPGDVTCDCNVTKLEVESDPVGPNSPKKLESTVKFKATTNWSLDTSIHMNVFVGSQLTASHFGVVNNNLSCGDDIQEEFEFVNKKLDNEGMSGHPIVDIVIFVNHPDNPHGGDLSCDNPLCKRFQVYYHFPPSPENVLMSHKPTKATIGDAVSIKCSTTDGYPKVEEFAIRALGTDNQTAIYEPNSETNKSVYELWTFKCEAISYPFGNRVVVQSKIQFKVVNETADLEELEGPDKPDMKSLARFSSGEAHDNEPETNTSTTTSTENSTTTSTENSTITSMEILTTSGMNSSSKDEELTVAVTLGFARSTRKLKAMPGWTRKWQKPPTRPSRRTRKHETKGTTVASKVPITLTSQEAIVDPDAGGSFDAQIADRYFNQETNPFKNEGQFVQQRATSGGMKRFQVIALELAMMGISLVFCHLW